MNFKNCRILWVGFFYFLQTLLFGQEENLEEQPPPGVELKTNSLEQDQRQIAGAETNGPESERISTIFYIRTVDFEVKGRGYTHSRTFALLRQGDFKAGEQISGKEGLKEYIINKTQLLLNHRVLESVEIDYTQGEAEAEGVPIDLLVKVVDTWNIIALPYPKFDSNSGFELILKARDYNFLGTMVPLRLDLGYAYKEGEEQVSPAQHVFKVEIDSDIPFEGFGLNWNINFDHLFSYTLEDGDGFISYKNITGLSVEFPIKRTSLTVSFEENFILNEENPVRYKAEYGDFAPFYMSSQLKGSWKMPLGLRVAQFGELTYTPEVSGKIPYRIGGELEPWRKGPALTLSHRLGFGQINWIGNYRSGLEASLKNENTYNFYRQGWENNYGLSVTGHIIAARFLGVSSRFQFQQWFFDKTFSENRYPDHVQA
ncbi:MAG: hypothetical protein LBD29_01005, partial [Treponema sp.]|nr:hypothetical protein [Treponema sp.]